MKTIATTLICACMALTAGGAAAVGGFGGAGTVDAETKERDSMAVKDGTSNQMSKQDCKDHMAMSSKDGAKKDEAVMKKDRMCSDMLKKDGTVK